MSAEQLGETPTLRSRWAYRWPIVGLAIAVATAVAQTQDDFTLPNLAGWVLAWVGLWYPLDAILFSSVVPKRENAVLHRLQSAEVIVTPP